MKYLLKKTILLSLALLGLFMGGLAGAQELHCNEDVFTAFAYRSNANACFEFTYKGCRDLLEEKVYDIKSTCESENVVEVKDEWDGKILCTRDLKRCPDGSYVGRKEPSCDFAACPFYAEPEVCNEDKKRCSDGSYVKRSGPFCNFEECGTLKAIEDGKKECNVIWTGYKFDTSKNTCLETNFKGCENELYETKEQCEQENEIEDLEIKDEFTNCPLDYIPVCGQVNGVEQTYVNKCLMKLDGATIVGNGTCRQVNSLYTRIINWILNLFK